LTIGEEAFRDEALKRALAYALSEWADMIEKNAELYARLAPLVRNEAERVRAVTPTEAIEIYERLFPIIGKRMTKLAETGGPRHI